MSSSGKAISVPADLSKSGEVERLVKEVEKHTDHVDILLANAGATWGAPFDEHPEEAFGKVIDLNVKSVFVSIQKYDHVPALRANRHIATTNSTTDSLLSFANEPALKTLPE